MQKITYALLVQYLMSKLIFSIYIYYRKPLVSIYNFTDINYLNKTCILYYLYIFRILLHVKKGRRRKEKKSMVYVGLQKHHVLFYRSSKYLINLYLNNFKPTSGKS